jgi:outer membrane cobalamin receptor
VYLCGQKGGQMFNLCRIFASDMNLLRAVIGILMLATAMSASAIDLPVSEVPDTNRIYSIGEITITEQYRSAELRSSSPLQLLSSKQLMQLNALQVSDAVKFFSGVVVKDYGGIGGLKTVSVRSLGASHTAVSYDGIIVNDNQTGQPDIGRFSLDNVEALSLHNGQSDQIFQPARQFGSAAVLNIRSRNPLESASQLHISLKSGSFGLLNPSIFFSKKLNSRVATSLSAEWLRAHGRYPYKFYYHPSGTGLFTSETRTNSDVENLRLEGSLHARFSLHETAWLKAYYYRANRGLPGATILYATENFSTQRLTDRSFFVRGHYERTFNPLWLVQWNGNYQRGNLEYTDTAYLNADGRQYSNYTQQEVYNSVSVLYRVLPGVSVSLSSDGIAGNMDAVFENDQLTKEFARPTRFTLLNVLAAKFVNERVLATGSLLSTLVHEQVRSGTAANRRQHLSPYVSVSWKPFEAEDVRLRAFYKDIFRLPTFNDLYYSRIGNVGLRPETTHQWNLGVNWTGSPFGWLPLISISADGYYNRVHDKIVAVPTKNIFVWSMVNLGEVAITGTDLSAESSFAVGNGYALVVAGTYSYQRALDITDAGSGTYGHQIAYTPRISGSARAGFTTPAADFAYSAVWSGKRYASGENFAENRLPGYSDQGISVSREFRLGKKSKRSGSTDCALSPSISASASSTGSNSATARHSVLSSNSSAHPLISIRGEINNLFDEQYAVVRWYPMPGRNYRLVVNVKF